MAHQLKMNFKFMLGLFALAVALGGCRTPAQFLRAPMCPLPMREGVPEYLCKHCNCIMQVADGEWDQPCNVCNCKKTFKECL